MAEKFTLSSKPFDWGRDCRFRDRSICMTTKKGNMLLFPASTQAGDTETVQCRERLGGLLKYYERGAA